MILTALAQYYDNLNQKGNKVPSFGFSEEKISYVLVISKSGELMGVRPHLTSEKKPKPRYMSVPQSCKRSGKSVKPFFLWDKTAYVLGVDVEKDKKNYKVSLNTFEAFRDYHLKLLRNVQDMGLQALKKFLTRWQPDQFENSILEPEILGTNIVFQLDGTLNYLHQSKKAMEIWASQLMPEEDKKGLCLITGKSSSIARLHPAIKGVSGGQSSGVSIVSFNINSFESFGKKQGDNAPVSEMAAFAYTTALNYLLRRENNQVISLGETTVVFWALANTPTQAEAAETFFKFSFNPTTSDDAETKLLFADLEKLSKGRPISEIAPDLDPNTQFFILGLSPNAARLSIRFWLQTDLRQLHQRFAEHFQDLALDPLPWKTPPSIWRLLLELVPHRSGQKPKAEDIPTHLAGELMRAILMGHRYPRSILTHIVARFRSDGHLSGLRVAMVKAVLQRDFRKQLIKEEVPMSLEESNHHPAYLLGRLFAVLENIQRIALGDKVNATIVDKYYASASSVPFSVFPRLLAGSKHHLSKIRKDKPSFAVSQEKNLGQIMMQLPTEFPRHFSIEDQGRFAMGYYHQKNVRFTQSNQPTTEGED